MGTVIRRESPVEYFKEMVEAALEHQKIATSELTEHYLVNLLVGFTFGGRNDEKDISPLGVQFIKALGGSGAGKATQLRTVGDRSLFITGFFSDSLKRGLADVDYYAALGARAYSVLGQEAAGAFAAVFAELGRRFISFVDVLNEVSEQSALTSNNDLLRLYEKWLRTGSRRDADLLVKKGIVPLNPARGKLMQ